MMDSDNIGDFLYLILLVVFGIIGVFSKKKKKPAGNPGPSAPTKDIFETLFPSDQQFEPVKETIYENEDEPDYEAFSAAKSKTETVTSRASITDYTSKLPQEGMSIHNDTYSHNIMGSEISDQIKNVNPIKAGEIGYENMSSKYDLSDSEEIRKAIIYSEILKAKYIN